MINYLNSYTERFREWLAWKIFPEFSMYGKLYKSIGEIAENERCVKALEEANSACAGWAVDTIKIKFVSVFWDDLNKDFKEQGYDEPPF